MFKKAIRQGRLLPQDFAIPYDKALLYMGDTVVKYGQFSKKLEDVSPEKVFKDAKKIGISPYYNEWVRFSSKRGKQPEKHVYYEYYKSNKNRFNCY